MMSSVPSDVEDTDLIMSRKEDTQSAPGPPLLISKVKGRSYDGVVRGLHNTPRILNGWDQHDRKGWRGRN